MGVEWLAKILMEIKVLGDTGAGVEELTGLDLFY
jgi:hypothetical protein